MKSFRKISDFEIEITEEDGSVNTWTREDYARRDKRNGFNYNKKMKIKGFWFVKQKQAETEVETEE